MQNVGEMHRTSSLAKEKNEDKSKLWKCKEKEPTLFIKIKDIKMKEKDTFNFETILFKLLKKSNQL